MRAIADIYPWFFSQVALTKDTLEVYKSPATSDYADTEDLINYCTNRINNLEILCDILEHFDRYDMSLPPTITLNTLIQIRNFCISEREMYTDKVNADLQIPDKFYMAIMNSDAVIYYQEAEWYIIKLIVKNGGTV